MYFSGLPRIQRKGQFADNHLAGSESPLLIAMAGQCDVFTEYYGAERLDEEDSKNDHTVFVKILLSPTDY